MSQKGKRSRDRATLEGVNLKMLRAFVHAQEAQTIGQAVYRSGPYPFRVEVKRGGLEHRYRAQAETLVDPMLNVVLGDFVHNLRSSLDHLAYQLVLLNGRTPWPKIALPIYDARPGHYSSRWFGRRWKAKPLDIAKEVSREALKIIESVQPYSGSHDGLLLSAVRDLNNFDKHRELILAGHVAREAVTSHLPNSPYRTGKWHFTGLPLVNENVVAVVTYDIPMQEADPDAALRPTIEFGEVGPLNGFPVDVALGILFDVVQDVVSHCQPLFRGRRQQTTQARPHHIPVEDWGPWDSLRPDST
jgi:hypothetical protein